jgi:hypothetical protein
MFVLRVADCDISITKRLPRDDVLAHRLEVEEARLVNSWLRDNAPWRALVNNFCPCDNVRWRKTGRNISE